MLTEGAGTWVNHDVCVGPWWTVLTRRRWTSVFDLTVELTEVDTAEAFLSAATAGLQAALQVDVTAYCEWHPGTRRPGRVLQTPVGGATVAGAQTWEQHHPNDPWIRHVTSTGDRQAVRLTDIASRAELSRSPTYQDCYRPNGFRFMAHLPLLMGPDTCAAVGIGSGIRDLDDDVVHLFQALQRPLAATRRRFALTGQDLEQSPVPDVIEHVGTVWVVRGRKQAEGLVDAEQAGRLTARQSEVLALVAAGLTNDQIGRRLGLSPRTVKKHLEGIFARLQAPSRSAAAAWWAESHR